MYCCKYFVVAVIYVDIRMHVVVVVASVVVDSLLLLSFTGIWLWHHLLAAPQCIPAAAFIRFLCMYVCMNVILLFV